MNYTHCRLPMGWLITGAFLLALGSGPCAAAAGPDPMLLKALEALALAETLGDRLWPGFHLGEIPLAVYRPGGEAYLINHPAPPSGFTEFPAPIPVRCRIYHVPKTELFDAATSAPINGVLTAVIPFDADYAKLGKPAPAGVEQIGLIFHEAFHVFQESWKTPPFNFLVFSRYPVDSALNNALGNLEGVSLQEALSQSAASKVENLARVFLAVRRERQRQLDEEAAAYENGTEILEGLAQYIQFRVLVLAEESDRKPLSALADREPGFRDYRQAKALLQGQVSRLAEINRRGRDAQRLRFYYTGLAQALVLDQLAPGWQKGYAADAKYLPDLLAGIAIPQQRRIRELQAEIERQSRQDLAAAQARHGFTQRLAEEESAAAAFHQQKQKELADFLQAPGLRITFNVKKLGGMGGWYMDPMNQNPISAQIKIHTRMLRITYGAEGISLDFQRPVVQDDGQMQYTIVPPAAGIRLECDGAEKPADVPGEHVCARTLRISGEGFSIQGRAARVTVDAGAMTVEFER